MELILLRQRGGDGENLPLTHLCIKRDIIFLQGLESLQDYKNKEELL
jgi:hypothetical protein